MIYDLNDPDDRLKLVLSAPDKLRRMSLLAVIRRDYGDAEAERIKARLRAMVAQ